MVRPSGQVDGLIGHTGAVDVRRHGSMFQDKVDSTHGSSSEVGGERKPFRAQMSAYMCSGLVAVSAFNSARIPAY